jgi:hypothetical protein
VTPSQRHSGEAVAISRHRSRGLEQARHLNLRRWSRFSCCFHQLEVDWINPLPPRKRHHSDSVCDARLIGSWASPFLSLNLISYDVYILQFLLDRSCLVIFSVVVFIMLFRFVTP